MAEPSTQPAHPSNKDIATLYNILLTHSAAEIHIWQLVRDEQGAIKTWRLVDINPAGLKGWGRTKDEVIGKTTNEIFPNTDAVKQFMPIVQKIFRENAPYQWETYFPGTKQHLSMTSYPAGEYFISTGVDISKQKEAEEMLRESKAHRAFLTYLANVLRPLTDPAAITRTITQTLGNHLDAAHVWIALFHPNGTATIEHDYTAKGAASLAGHYPNNDLAMLTELLRAGQTLVVRESPLTARPAEKKLDSLTWLPHKAFIVTPIFINGRLAAMLGVGESAARDWADADVRLVEEVAKQSWPDLQRARAEQALQTSAARQTFLLKLSDLIRPFTDPAAIEAIITHETMVFFNTDRCYFIEIVGDKAICRRDAARGDLPSVAGEYQLSQMPIFQTVLAAGLPFVVQDAATSELLDEPLRQLCIQLQIISFLDVPLIKYGQPVGILCLTQATQRSWTDADRSLVMEIAERTWTAVERGKAETELRQLNAEMEQRVDDRTAELLTSNKNLAQEIGERTQAEKALRRSEAHLAEAQRIAHLGSWEWTAATDSVTWSSELYRMLAVNPGEPPPNMTAQAHLYTPESFERMKTAVAHTMRTGAQYEVELECVQTDGSRRWLLSRGERWLDEQGQPIGLRGTALDITERKRAEKALRQSKDSLEETLEELRETQELMMHRERLAAVGQLAAGIAHDFNNILTTILSFADVLQLAPTLPASLQPKVQMITAAGKQAAQLVSQLLDYTQKTIRRPQHVKLDNLLREQTAFLQRTIPENIQLTLNIAPGNYIVEADTTQISQAITNLAVNARDAMPTGGQLTLSLAQVEAAGQELCEVCRQPIAGTWFGLTVMDNGIGMDAPTIHHIFEPFFTTKEDGQGTGLGLAQVSGIIIQHGGHITVNTLVGQGTTCTIYLPPAVESIESEVEQTPEVVVAGQGQTVLLVEDQPAVIEAIRAILGELGYQVITAANGRKALAAYTEHQADIALVLSDLVMPDMDGEALFRALKAQTPDVNMVLMSGYPLGERGAAMLQQGLVAWLKKPFTLTQLSQVLDKALARGGRKK